MEEDCLQRANDLFMRSVTGWAAVDAALAGHPHDSDISRRMMEALTEQMKTAADAVYEDLRYKLSNAPRTYFQRLAAWVSSPAYGFVASPCAVGVVTALAKNTAAGVGVYVALGSRSLSSRPSWEGCPSSVSTHRWSPAPRSPPPRWSSSS